MYAFHKMSKRNEKKSHAKRQIRSSFVYLFTISFFLSLFCLLFRQRWAFYCTMFFSFIFHCFFFLSLFLGYILFSCAMKNAERTCLVWTRWIAQHRVHIDHTSCLLRRWIRNMCLMCTRRSICANLTQLPFNEFDSFLFVFNSCKFSNEEKKNCGKKVFALSIHLPIWWIM